MSKLVNIVALIFKRVVSDKFPNKYEIVILICIEKVILNSKTHSMCKINKILVF